MAQLAEHELSAVLEVVSEVRESIVNAELTIFEHGGCLGEESASSACVSHAHWHILPGDYDLGRSDLEWIYQGTSLIDGLRATPSEGYLWLMEPSGIVRAACDPKRPQFFRRRIFESLGRPDEWDYAACPQWDAVRATQGLFVGDRER
jgi:hypothetical protein